MQGGPVIILMVSGHRNMSDQERMNDALDLFVRQHGNPSKLIHGAAAGADSLANRWAIAREIEVEKYPADWSREGKAAGPIRNERMALACTHLVAFPSAYGSGTQHAIKCAKRLKRIVQVWHEGMVIPTAADDLVQDIQDPVARSEAVRLLRETCPELVNHDTDRYPIVLTADGNLAFKPDPVWGAMAEAGFLTVSVDDLSSTDKMSRAMTARAIKRLGCSVARYLIFCSK